MQTLVCLLRAVNVGGTGKLPMADLRALCDAAGFADVRTCLASGNVVLRSAAAPARVRRTLESALAQYAGKPVGVLVRTAAEMAAVLAGNPFPDAAPNRALVVFLDQPPPADALERMTGQRNEQVVPGTRELYVHYRDGIAGSKLRIPDATTGTARNLNTVRRLVAMSVE